MMCNNPNVDLVNMNVNIKFGENMSSSSQNIKRKRESSLNQGPLLWYKFENCENPKLDLAKMNAYIKFCEILPIVSQDIELK